MKSCNVTNAMKAIEQYFPVVAIYYSVIERFSLECSKTKTKVITLTNHNSRKPSNEPIKARSKYM